MTVQKIPALVIPWIFSLETAVKRISLSTVHEYQYIVWRHAHDSGLFKRAFHYQQENHLSNLGSGYSLEGVFC